MKYMLKKLVLDRTPDIPINEDRFESLKKARKTLTEVFSIEEKYELLLSNFLDFIKEPLILSAENMVREEVSYSGYFDIRLSLNRRIVNLLTSSKMYIDHLLGHIQVFASMDEKVKDTVKGYLSEKYDISFEYRFMEAIRNHVQHRGLVVHSTPIGGMWKEEEDIKQMEYGINIYAQKKILAENRKFKKSILKEMPEKVELQYASKVYVSHLNDIHIKVRNKVKDIVDTSRGVLQDAILEYSEACSGHAIGLNAVSYKVEDEKLIIIEEVPILLDWDDVRIELEKRNKKIINLSKRYVSGNTYNKALHKTSR